jgi:acetylornithine deacetylase/succinyl-diaminopimelate desuccinylase-like protein
VRAVILPAYALRRLDRRLDALYALAGGPPANRPFGSAGEQEAHELAAAWMEEAGLLVEVDADGNLLGRGGERPDLWVGSHLDSVPQGGRFDGALGVVAAIEAVAASGYGTVAVFRGEEVGCVGSRALVARGAPLPSAFLELHIEQGPLLERAGLPVGVASGIVAYARGTIELAGRAGHAGTTPMDARDDALCKAAETILRVRECACAIEGAVATVGRIEVEPGAVNVIPGRARLSVDARAPDGARLDALLAAIGLEAEQRTEAVVFAERVRAVLRASIAAHGLAALELASGAGHDAGILAAAGVEAGMLLVRSLNGGASHCPQELSSAEDIALALAILTDALRRLAG